MTTTELIDQHVDIEPHQRDRIAELINHYVDVCHVNDTTIIANHLAPVLRHLLTTT